MSHESDQQYQAALILEFAQDHFKAVKAYQQCHTATKSSPFSIEDSVNMACCLSRYADQTLEKLKKVVSEARKY